MTYIFYLYKLQNIEKIIFTSPFVNTDLFYCVFPEKSKSKNLYFTEFLRQAQDDGEGTEEPFGLVALLNDIIFTSSTNPNSHKNHIFRLS